MWKSAELRALLALNLVVAAATGLVVVNTVVYVRDLLGSQGSGLAVALACYGGGSMVAAVSVPHLLAMVSERTIMLAGAAIASVGLTATTLFLLAAPHGSTGWAALGTLWAIIGAGTSMVNTPSARLLRRSSTPDNRAQIFTAQFSLSHAGFLLTYPIAGWVGATLSQVVAALLLTALATLATLAAITAWSRPGKDWHGTTSPEALVTTASQPGP